MTENMQIHFKRRDFNVSNGSINKFSTYLVSCPTCMSAACSSPQALRSRITPSHPCWVDFLEVQALVIEITFLVRTVTREDSFGSITTPWNNMTRNFTWKKELSSTLVIKVSLFTFVWHTWGRWVPPVQQADCAVCCYWDLEYASWQDGRSQMALSAGYYHSDTKLLNESFATNWDSSSLYCLLSPTPTNEISSPIDSPQGTWVYTYDVGWSFHTCPCDCGTWYNILQKN